MKNIPLYHVEPIRDLKEMLENLRRLLEKRPPF